MARVHEKFSVNLRYEKLFELPQELQVGEKRRSLVIVIFVSSQINIPQNYRSKTGCKAKDFNRHQFRRFYENCEALTQKYDFDASG